MTSEYQDLFLQQDQDSDYVYTVNSVLFCVLFGNERKLGFGKFLQSTATLT